MSGPRWVSVGARPGARPTLLGHAGLPAPLNVAHRARAWLTYPILAVLFAFMGPYSLHPIAATGDGAKVGASAAATATNVEEGTRTRQAAVLLLAGFAALLLSATRRRRNEAARTVGESPVAATQATYASSYGAMSTSVHRLINAPASAASTVGRSPLLLFLLIGYVGLASVSILWSGDPTLSAKRAVVFLVFALTAFALAQAWSLREILYFAMFASASSLILGIGGAIGRGDFLPLGADYRFVGFGNPNLHGIEAACLVISSTIALQITTKKRVLFVGLLVFGFGMLIMTKSRTALAGVVMAAGVSSLLSVRRGRLVTIAIVAVIVAFTLIVFLPDSVTHAHTAVLLGRSAETDDPATLSGRTLLWEDLLYFAADRPWLGYGFDSFWTPTHIAAVSLRRGWVITQSHSGYIEALLNVGIVGASLLVLTLSTGVRTAIRRYRGLHTPLALFAVAMLVWYMTNLLAEAIPEAHFSTLTIMVILAHLALRDAAPDDSETATAGQP